MDRPLRTAPQNVFQIYGELAVVETFVGETTHDAAESANYRRILDLLWVEAVTDEDARQLIITASGNLASYEPTRPTALITTTPERI